MGFSFLSISNEQRLFASALKLLNLECLTSAMEWSENIDHVALNANKELFMVVNSDKVKKFKKSWVTIQDIQFAWWILQCRGKFFLVKTQIVFIDYFY